MLTPIKGKARYKRHIAYDLEWYPETLKLRLIGVYDGKDKKRPYRWYRTVAKFLDAELTHTNRGVMFFAHAGGSFDVQFILEELVRNPGGYQIAATFSGSSAVIVKLTKNGHSWLFCDSFFLLRAKLEKIGQWLGMAKGDSGAIFEENFLRLIEYNARDCEIVWHAVENLQQELLSLGGELRPTIASCAMALFRRKYLKRSIRNSQSLNEQLAPAYTASRVEPFRRTASEGVYYDVNSSFPWSMTHPQPGSLDRIGSGLSDRLDALYIASCEIEVPSCDIPPLPFRGDDGRVFFPVGRWSGMFDVEDIRLLEETGGKVHKVDQVYYFEPFTDLADYVFTLYELKKNADPKSYVYQVYKYLLNACYGKFTERPDKRSILIHPEYTYCTHDPRHDDSSCMRMLSPGIWEVRETKTIPHAHMPVGIHTTAKSRAKLTRGLLSVSTPFYCDTDSITCGKDDIVTPVGTELGEWKKEYEISDAEFLAPKLYTFIDKTKGERVVKSKGFSRLTYDQFRSLAEGREIVFERMARMRECLRMGDYEVQNISIRKQLRGAMPKRRMLDNGTSVPWTVSEVLERVRR